MYSISERTQKLLNSNVYQEAYIVVTFGDGTSGLIENDDIIQGGMSVDRYSISGSSIELGTAIAAELNLKLNNHDGRFDNKSFANAQMNVSIKITDPDAPNATPATIPMGHFRVCGSPRNIGVISITALDKMTLLDIPVNKTLFTFPTTIPTILSTSAIACGISWDSTTISTIGARPNSDIDITMLPTTEDILTYRQLLMWCAGMLGMNLYVDYNGNLNLAWYKCGYFDEEEEEPGYSCNEHVRYSSDLYVNDEIYVSGYFYKDKNYQEYLYGGGNYVIDMSSNPLVYYTTYDYGSGITADGPDLVLNNLQYPPYGSNNFITYHPYNAEIKPAPHLWPMDAVLWALPASTNTSDDEWEVVTGEDDPETGEVIITGDDDEFEEVTGLVEDLHETITHTHYVLNGTTSISAMGETPSEHQVAPASSGLVGGYFKVVTVTSTVSVSASSPTASKTFAVNPGEGWMAIGLVGSSTSQSWCMIRQQRLVDGSVQMATRYFGSSTNTQTVTLTADVLCQHVSVS